MFYVWEDLEENVRPDSSKEPEFPRRWNSCVVVIEKIPKKFDQSNQKTIVVYRLQSLEIR